MRGETPPPAGEVGARVADDAADGRSSRAIQGAPLTWIRRCTQRPTWATEGTDPDYRFSLANERTFLAWIRTALALIAGSVAVVQVVPSFGVPGARRILAVGVAVGAAALCVAAYRRWVGNESAMRKNKALPYGRLPAVAAVGLAVLAVFVAVLALWQ